MTIRIKLNGWHRIGVILSVAWFFIGFIWASNSQMTNAQDRTAFTQQECASVQNQIPAGPSYGNEFEKMGHDCDRLAHQTYEAAMANNVSSALLAGLIPIPIGWAIVYICLWLARWVRRGFVSAG